MCRREIGLHIKEEEKKLKIQFWKNYKEWWHDTVFKVGKYKRKKGYFLYAKDAQGYWRLIAKTTSALAMTNFIWWLKRYSDIAYRRPYVIIDKEVERDSWDELRDLGNEWEEVVKECGD